MQERHDFNLLLVHIADLDHNVHMDRLSSKKTVTILKEDDLWFQRLIDSLDDDTILMVTSDHGLIETGHGGTTPEEKSSLMFVYRRKGLLGSHQFMSKYLADELAVDEIDSFDLTPTLGLLLNNTPPFNSVGDFVAEVMPLPDDKSDYDIARMLLHARTEIIKQKVILMTSLENKGSNNPELRDNMTILISKSERLLEKTDQPQEIQDSLTQQMVNLFKEMRVQIGLFKKYSSKGAIVYDSKSAKFVMVLSIVGIAALLISMVVSWNSFIDTNRIDYNIKHFTIMSVAGVCVSYILEISYAAGIMTVVAPCQVLIALFEGFYTCEGVISIIGRVIWYFKFLLTTQRAALILMVPMIVYRILENNNCTYTEQPFHSLLLAKMISDYVCCTLSMMVAGKHENRGWSNIRWLRRRITFIAGEFMLFYLMSIGDFTFLTTFKSTLDKQHNMMLDYSFEIGTVVPGFAIYGILAYVNILQCKFNLKSWCIFTINYIIALACIKYSQIDILWGRQVFPCVVLSITILSMWYNMRSNSDEISIKYKKVVLAGTTVLPLVLLVGGPYSVYNTLLLFLITLLNFRHEEELNPQLAMNMMYVLRLAYYASGSRMTMPGLYLNCGTMFYNDYHALSWLTVLVNTTYPYITGTIIYLCLTLKHQHSADLVERGRSRLAGKDADDKRQASGLCRLTDARYVKQVQLFYLGLNIGALSDAIGLSIIFFEESENIMIFLGTASILYQLQIFIAVSGIKLLFFSL